MAKFDAVSLSILLPTYNEAEHIASFIAETARQVKEHFTCSFFEILVIDDDSPDRTWEAAEASGVPEARVIRRTGVRGLASALAEGAAAARGDIVAWMDCDFSQPPSSLPQLVAAVLTGWDVAVNSRYVGCGGDIRKGRFAWIQMVLSALFNHLARAALGNPFRDYTSGFIAIRRDALLEIGIHGDYGEYFIGLIARAYGLGKKVIELPYTLGTRRSGDSKTFTGPWDILTRGCQYLGGLAHARRGARRLRRQGPQSP